MKHGWIDSLLLLLIAAGALAIRMPQLELRPMHADEAVQAARFRDWWQTGNYVYDPNEYHGPTLIYATRPSVIGGGSDTFAETSAATYRAVPAVFGVGMVLLLWLLRDALGRAGLLWSAILVGCSPAGVFYSRYYIHETLLAFFTLAAIACGWRYVRSGRVAWCLAAGAMLGLMQATKETAAIAYLAAAVAWSAVALPARRSRQHDHMPPLELAAPGAGGDDGRTGRSRAPVIVLHASTRCDRWCADLRALVEPRRRTVGSHSPVAFLPAATCLVACR